ncbi:hypothetical protein MIR68_007849 [Amoeboaphelidium protococcarum]|nr:hypothetical protein MIR68_007849 [Amoeboaphelidium protococcarum]
MSIVARGISYIARLRNSKSSAMGAGIKQHIGDELNREQLEFLETLKEEEDVDIKYQMRRYYLFATRRLALDHNLRISESVTAEKLRYKAKDTLKEEYRNLDPELPFCERVDDQIELWINAVVMVVANFK